MTDQKDIFPFGEWLKSELDKANMPQMELALQLGMCQGQISRYVTGLATPTLENIIRIMAVFGKRLMVVDSQEKQ